MSAPLFKVYHFPQYARPRTVAVFFTLGDAETFALQHGHEYAANGCYVAAFYPSRTAIIDADGNKFLAFYPPEKAAA